MMKLLLTLLLITNFTPKVWAKSFFALKGGTGLAFFKARNGLEPEDDPGNEEHHAALSFHTQFVYHSGSFEYGVASYVHIGQMKDFRFNVNNNTFIGDGLLIGVSYGPIIKYYTHYSPRDPWRLYVGIGPSWTLQSVNVDGYQVTSGTFSNDYKFSYETRGALIVIGFEEMLPHKEMHPSYVELLFNYQEAFRASIHNKGDYQEVELIEKQRIKRNVKGFIIALSVGITFF